MDEKQELKSRLDIADQLIEMSTELSGVAEILFIAREFGKLQGESQNDYLLTLEKALLHYSQKLRGIGDII